MRVDGKIINPTSNVGKQTVHNVHILDASGSMSGSKYDNAINSIKEEMNVIKGNTDVNYTTTIIEFDSGYASGFTGNIFIETAKGSSARITQHNFLTPIGEYKDFKAVGAHGGTPLYETIGLTIDELLTKVKPEDKVIMTITTDGQENASYGIYKNPIVLKELLDKVQAKNNFTITFMGTEFDVETMINSLKISKNNTLVHQNTGESIGASYKLRSASLTSYSKAVASGDITSVTMDFFKSVK